MESFLIVVFALVAYFLPAIVAARRNVPSVGSVVVINLLLGWTLIGWAVALAMAFRDPRPAVSAAPQLPVLSQPPAVRNQAAAKEWWKR